MVCSLSKDLNSSYAPGTWQTARKRSHAHDITPQRVTWFLWLAVPGFWNFAAKEQPIPNQRNWMAWCKRDVSDFFRWNFFSFKSAWIFSCAFQLSSTTFPCIFFFAWGPVPERRNNSIPGINVPYFRDNFIPGINSVPERWNNTIKGIKLG